MHCARLMGVVALTFVMAVGSAAKPPAGTELIAKYFEALGGKTKLEAIKNRVTKGKLVLLDMGMEAAYIDYTEPPKVYNESDFQGMGVVKNGFAKGYSWGLNPFAGNNLEKSGGTPGLIPLLNWEKTYDTAETVGEATVDDVSCYKVVLTRSKGKPRTLFFAKDTGFLIRSVRQSNAGEQSSTYGDYKEVAGIMSPHRRGERGGPYDIDLIFETAEFNVDIPASQFEMPDEIKAMIE